MYCGSVDSRGKYEPQYGYYEVKLKIADSDKWTHTAFWFQGNLQHAVDGTANDGAEIDVFESAWEDEKVGSVIHYDGYGANKKTKPIIIIARTFIMVNIIHLVYIGLQIL